jgi:hypothetical protein
MTGRTIHFFKAEPLGPQEAPDRVVADEDAACGKKIDKPVQGQVRGILDPGEDEIPVRRQECLAVPADLSRV